MTKMKKLVIRVSLPCDIDEMKAIENLCFTDPWSREGIAASVASPINHWSCAILDGKIVGFLGTQVISPEAEIISLCCHPDYRRQGIASALLSRFFSSFPDLKSVFLEVRASNSSAQALYCSFGFKPYGIRKSYYEYPEEDAILFSRTNPVEELC